MALTSRKAANLKSMMTRSSLVDYKNQKAGSTGSHSPLKTLPVIQGLASSTFTHLTHPVGMMESHQNTNPHAAQQIRFSKRETRLFCINKIEFLV